MSDQQSAARLNNTDPVVIIGMALEAPGDIDTAEAYWALLSQQREALGPFPTDRGWPIRDLLTGSGRDGFKKIHDSGGFLTGAATFDPEFFGISPREAVTMDPQQRVALRLPGVRWRTAVSTPTTSQGTTSAAMSVRRLPATDRTWPNSPATAAI